MKYTSVKKFTLEEEDMNAVARTCSILRHVYEKMDDNDSFRNRTGRMIMTKDGVNEADGLLDLFLTIVTDDDHNSIFIEYEQE